MKRYYIAYGSNLSVEQMAWRCPDAKVVGKAMLKDWKLVFRVHATIEPCPGREVPVLVWEISEQDEASLDRYEGFPRYYTKQEMEVDMTALGGKRPRKVKAMVYIMAPGREVQLPMKGYYDTIAGGYIHFGFDLHIPLTALREAKEAMDAYAVS